MGNPATGTANSGCSGTVRNGDPSRLPSRRSPVSAVLAVPNAVCVTPGAPPTACHRLGTASPSHRVIARC